MLIYNINWIFLKSNKFFRCGRHGGLQCDAEGNEISETSLRVVPLRPCRATKRIYLPKL